MSELNNCLLPDELLYHVENNVWLRDNGDGTYDMGMTDIAQTMAGSIIHCRPKAAGKKVKKGKSVATVESGKWVGPVKTPLTAEITARNDAIEADASILNKSPYMDGWIVRIRPVEMDAEQGELVSGDDAVAGFRTYMSEKELGECIHCEGFEG